MIIPIEKATDFVVENAKPITLGLLLFTLGFFTRSAFHPDDNGIYFKGPGFVFGSTTLSIAEADLKSMSEGDAAKLAASISHLKPDDTVGMEIRRLRDERKGPFDKWVIPVTIVAVNEPAAANTRVASACMNTTTWHKELGFTRADGRELESVKVTGESHSQECMKSKATDSIIWINKNALPDVLGSQLPNAQNGRITNIDAIVIATTEFAS